MDDPDQSTGWVTAKSGTAHFVHEPSTDWAQSEHSGALVFMCGRSSSRTLVDSDNGRHCKACAKKQSV